MVCTMLLSEYLLTKIFPVPFVIFSLNVTVAVWEDATFTAPFAGNREAIVGPARSTTEFFGDGTPDTKSALLLSESCARSVEMLNILCIEFVLEGAVAGAVSKPVAVLP